MATPTQVLDLCRSQLGVCENPMGSNSGTPYHAWYGSYCQGWQWCAIFVSWVIWHIDQALFYGLMTAYSGDYLNVGRMHLREIDISQIAPGDICIWDRPVGGITDHIGFVESVSVGNFTTIEGNSGDCVKRNTHDRVQTSSCHYYFVRPQYNQTPPPVKKEQEDDDMVEATVGKAAVIPSYTDSAKDQHCDLAIANQANAVTKVRLFFKRDSGKGDASQDFAKVHTIDIGPELVYRQDVLVDWKVEGGIGVKVEVLSGGPVHVYRNNPRK